MSALASDPFRSFSLHFGKSSTQRERVLVNGGLLEVHLGAGQQAVVNFMFAAIVVIPERGPRIGLFAGFAAISLSSYLWAQRIISCRYLTYKACLNLLAVFLQSKRKEIAICTESVRL